MALFSKKSTNTSQSFAEITNANIQDNQGLAIAGNRGAVTLTDGGAIAGSFELAGYAMETAAALTLGLVSGQAKESREAMQETYAFAMNAGRGEVATMQDTTQKIMIMVGIIAAAWVAYGMVKR